MDNKTKINNEPVPKRTLTEQEANAVARINKKRLSNSPEVVRLTEKEGKESLELSLDNTLKARDARDLFDSDLMEITGATDSSVGINLLTSAAQAISPAKPKLKDYVLQINTLALSMQALAPQDEYEGQLIAQLFVLHDHAMDWLTRAKNTERVDFANVYLNGASKLLCRHHETMEALLKYRRKGEQRVHVEHVHVHGGGQAIVGNVISGGGVNPKIEEGPHAKV